MNRGVDQIQGEKPVVENNLLMITPLYNPVSAPHAPNNLSDEAKTLHGPNASPSAQSNQSVRVCMCVHITYAAETWTVTQKKLRQLRAFYTKYFHNIPGHGHTEVARAHRELARAHTEVARAHTEVARAHTEVARAHTEVARAHTEVARAHTEL